MPRPRDPSHSAGGVHSAGSLSFVLPLSGIWSHARHNYFNVNNFFFSRSSSFTNFPKSLQVTSLTRSRISNFTVRSAGGLKRTRLVIVQTHSHSLKLLGCAHLHHLHLCTGLFLAPPTAPSDSVRFPVCGSYWPTD